jgi:hypothetical protein
MTIIRIFTADSQCLLSQISAIKPGTATAFPLRLGLHYKAARVGGVNNVCFFLNLNNLMSAYGTELP